MDEYCKTHNYLCINTYIIMCTTLGIPENLLLEAMKVTNAKTKSQVIKKALQAQIAKAKRQRLLSFKGKIDLDIDLNASRKC